jgi:hypothetical protein
MAWIERGGQARRKVEAIGVMQARAADGERAGLGRRPDRGGVGRAGAHFLSSTKMAEPAELPLERGGL